MSDIARVRELIMEVREELTSGKGAARLDLIEKLDLAERLSWREKPIYPKASPQPGATVTPAKKLQILMLKRRFPAMRYREIARRVDTDIGRVSEVLHGKR